MNSLLASDEVESASNAVLRHDFDGIAFVLQYPAINNAAKNRIVRDDRRCRPQSGAKAEVDFAAVLPRSSRLLLAEPIEPERLWNISARRRTVVSFSGNSSFIVGKKARNRSTFPSLS